jgi:hypothetical protein
LHQLNFGLPTYSNSAGNEAAVTLIDLRVLHPSFASVPFWALRVSLAGVRPRPNQHCREADWSDADLGGMAALLAERGVASRPSVVRIVGDIHLEEFVAVELYLPPPITSTGSTA